jgi:hypothetical protein
MALTVVQGKHNVNVTLDGSTDFDMAATVVSGFSIMPDGVRLTSVQFYPNAAGDVCIIREGSATGVIIMKAKDVGGAGVHREFYPHFKKPFIKGSEGISGSMVIFEFI